MGHKQMEYSWPVRHVKLICSSVYRRLGRGGRQGKGEREGGELTGSKSLLGAGLCKLLLPLLFGASFAPAFPPHRDQISHWPESDSPSLPPEPHSHAEGRTEPSDEPHSHAGSRSEPSDKLLEIGCHWAQLSPVWVPARLLDLSAEGLHSVCSL